MKRTVLILGLAFSLAAFAVEPGKTAETSAPTCPVTGKPANPAITCVYEGNTYAFADEAAKQKFADDRANSLYQKLGGKAAIDAAVELFYVKVLADKRVNHFFEDINMNKQKRKQKDFLSAALGGPIPYVGRDLRTAHESLGGLNDSHFDAIAENLHATLTELKVEPQLIAQAMAIVGSTRDAVLNRPAKAAAATTAPKPATP